MAALSRLIAKELSSALGITDNPKFNPMFKQTDAVLRDVSNPNNSTIAEFYSPLESAIENAPIGKEGTRGENIEAFVRKRAPKVTQAELDYREFSLDPAKKYTRGEDVAPGIVSYTTPAGTTKYVGSGAIDDGMEPLRISAVKKKTANQTMQRQGDLLDPEVGYEEIGVDIIGADLGLMTHYGSNNLAHARYSLRQNTTKKPRFDDDPDYTFIEELQSDVIQNMTDDPAKVMRDSIAKLRVKFDSDIDDIAFKREFEMPGSLFEEFDDFVFNELIPIGVNKKITSGDQTSAVRELFEKRGYKTEGVYVNSALEDMFKAMAFDKINVTADIPNKLSKMTRDFVSAVTESKVSVSKKEVPINKLTDSVRVLLQSIIADSKAKGIDEIVLPPIEKLAEKRFGTNPDESLSKAYKKAITKGSGFHNTYVVAYDKALKQLKAELGNQIKIGTKDLTYVEKGDFVILKGKSLNIKDLKLDPKTSKLRLNKGGLVQRPDR